MDKDVKEDWLDALRSGEYDQTQGVLENKYGNCCLGVLCDILDDVERFKSDGGVFFKDVSLEKDSVSEFDTTCSVNLPGSIEARINLCYQDTIPLIEMNDRGATFEQIADYIEAKL